MGRRKRIINYRPKYFPFSKGIPWKIDRGKFIIPEIDLNIWEKVTLDHNLIITAFGGLFESFFSLSIAEGIRSFDSSHKLYWLGNPKYEFFANAQGLCKISNINITPDILKEYPVPLFFDQENNAYINTLNNYLIKTAYWGKYPEPVNSPVVEQIFKNAMIPWDNYIPVLRNLGSEFYDELEKINHFTYKSKIITIIYNKTNDDVLNWNVNNIKEFSQLVTSKGFKIIVFTNNTSIFYGTKIIVHKYDIRKILQVIKKSWMVLSTDKDWLLISLMISNAKLISKNIDGPYNLFSNAEFLGSSNDIFTDQNRVSPIDAFTVCEGVL